MVQIVRTWRLVLLAGLLATPAVLATDSPAPAILVVRLPADATLKVGGNATSQTGAERTFQSPALPPGQTFTYQLTATWTENGKPHTVTRQALVRAGERTVLDLVNAAPTVSAAPPPPPRGAAVATRTFQFTYGATVTGLPPGKVARIWLPVPSSNDEQDVRMIRAELPSGNRLAREPQYGNQILYVEARPDAAGSVPLSVTYQVTRREVRGETPNHDSGVQLARLLQPDAKVPIGGKPLELLQGRALPSEQTAVARVLYDVVNGHLRDSKEGIGWGEGDVIWACESRYGNSADFHSLFIALARAQRIPAKFEIGFALPPVRGGGEVPGYHCWAKFRPAGKGWVPVDISEANKDPRLCDHCFGNLTENRVTFSTGRDVDLVPRQSAGPLNFFIYPHVEVDGAAYPASKVQRSFSYRDVPPEPGR
jgi:uncharacterized protein (TIGR03000 family)